MPQETDRLKLPLPLGNETVSRESINGIFEKIDAGVATQADLDALREAVSQMDIPDASLTQKGKVQLSSKTDGTSETVAATEKAVRDARVAAETNAKNASLPRTGGVLTGVLTAPQIEMPNGTTIRTDGTRTSINAAANRFDVISTDGQKYLFSSRSGDFYMYDEVGDLITTAKELKQSGVDAKNGVVGAINAKGGSASTNDTWAQLTTKINAINTGKRFAQGRAVLGGSSGTTTMMSVLGLAFQPSTVLYSVYNASDPHHAALGTTVNVSIRREQGSYSSSGISTTSSGFEARFTYWYNNLTVDWIAFE